MLACCALDRRATRRARRNSLPMQTRARRTLAALSLAAAAALAGCADTHTRAAFTAYYAATAPDLRAYTAADAALSPEQRARRAAAIDAAGHFLDAANAEARP